MIVYFIYLIITYFIGLVIFCFHRPHYNVEVMNRYNIEKFWLLLLSPIMVPVVLILTLVGLEDE